MSVLSDKVADPQYAALSSYDLSVLLNDPGGTEGSTIVGDRDVNAKQVLSELGVLAGAAFLDSLDSISAANGAVKWILTFLRSDSGVNVGDPETRGSLDAMVVDGTLDFGIVAAVKDMANKNVSWAQTNGIRVDPVRIQKLRGEI